MWAANTTTVYGFRPPVTAAATARSNHRRFTVSAKQSRPQKNIKFDYDDEEVEIDRELELLKQQQIGDLEVSASNPAKITGSTVLLALQKASAQKTSKKVKKKSNHNHNHNHMTGDGDNWRKQLQGDVIDDYSDVKPLRIRSDWKDRLDELEMQIHELINHT